MGRLPKRIEKPPHLIKLTQQQIESEKLLLWSLSINDLKQTEPYAAVIYGKGRRLGPILRKEHITGSTLYDILSIIGLSCEYGLDKKWMMGMQIPLR